MVKISVIIPVFNAEKYLEEAMNSILNQTFDNLEVICVDDGSKDNSLNMLYEFEKKDSRIQVYHLDENCGGGAARNVALPKAKGKYIYFMDADDILKLNALQELYDIAEEKKVDLIICKAIDYNSDTGEYYEEDYFTMDKLYNYVGDEIFNWKDIGELIFNISVTPWGKFYNREFVIDSGAKFAEGLIFHDNVFFWEMLFNSNSIFFYNKQLCYRRVHSESSVESKDKRFVNTLTIYNMIFEIFKKYGQFDKFMESLYNKKIRLAHLRFGQVQQEYKEFFFNEMKKDFTEMYNGEYYEKFIKIVTPFNRLIFHNVLKANTYIEYEQLFEINELKNNVNELKRNVAELTSNVNDLKSENKKLRKNYEKIKKTNESLLNSNSWKLTKPLRSIRNFK